MSFYCVGVNHRSAPVRLRERLAALGARSAMEVLSAEGWQEAVVLSTCNRFEIYAAGGRAGDPLKALSASIDRLAGIPAGAYRYAGRDAARHLFKVAAGLDSLVVGESEILGQVKSSYEAAHEAGRTAKRTNVLFQRALFVGKSVRHRTRLGEGHVSVASVAVELAKRIFGGLEKSPVLVLGAGDTAEKTARHLVGARVPRLYIANRTWERARALSARLNAETLHWDDFPAKLAEVDVVVASTGSPHPILTRSHVERALERRRGRSLFLIDIAMPRDVAEEVHEIDGVYRYGLEDLQGVAAENLTRRREDLDAGRAIVAAEAEKSGAWLASLETGREISLKHSDLRGRHAVPASVPAPTRA